MDETGAQKDSSGAHTLTCCLRGLEALLRREALLQRIENATGKKIARETDETIARELKEEVYLETEEEGDAE